jgi:hypothetical protein
MNFCAKVEIMSNISLIPVSVIMMLLGSTSPAAAGGMNFYDQCLLVPYVLYENAGMSTAVGVSARDSGTVYWQFRNARGSAATSGAFEVAANTLTPFIWSDAIVGTGAGAGFAGIIGSLTFCIDRNGNGRIDPDDGDILAANAFLIDLSSADVAFIPTANVDDEDLFDTRVSSFTSDRNLIRRLPDTARSNDFLDSQYLIDGIIDDGDDTRIVIWTSAALGGSRQSFTVYDASGASSSIRLTLSNPNLHIIDPEALSDAGGIFPGDGFLRWKIPLTVTNQTIYVFAFSIIFSPSFGAIQTVLGNY